MGDISKKGRGRAFLGGPLGGTGKRIKTYEEEVNAGPTESLGIYASGGHEGKPHSTKKGRIRAGQRELTRFFYGRRKKQPKGTKV